MTVQKSNAANTKNNRPLESIDETWSKPLDTSLKTNVQTMLYLTGQCKDVVVRFIHFGQVQCAVIYIEGLIDTTTVNQWIMQLSDTEMNRGNADTNALESVYQFASSVGKTTLAETLDHIWSLAVEGSTLILMEGYNQAIASSTAGGEQRGIEEPSTQTVIRGPKEGFTESLGTNIALLRRRIKSRNMRVEGIVVGKQTKTQVVLIYLEGIANPSIVGEVRKRVNQIDTDSILDSSYIEQFIEDSVFTLFPTTLSTERPDTASASLLDGQFVLLVDGSPFAIVAPVTFFKYFHASEDYFQRVHIASFLRMLRFGAYLLSVFLPSLYIAITTYHQEMLPTTLLISLAAQREGTPFPALVEAFIMEIIFELLREAGVRMPRAIGPAISIVGALVLGQAAVEAGLVSAAMVIVVSLTAISNFVLPNVEISATTRLIRFLLMLLAGTLGLYGIFAGSMVLAIQMVSLRSFGVPYVMPLAPLIIPNLKDTFVRFPIWSMRKRPKGIAKGNTTRQGKHQKPEPPES